jgi:hypothetical protein
MMTILLLPLYCVNAVASAVRGEVPTMLRRFVLPSLHRTKIFMLQSKIILVVEYPFYLSD